MPGTGQLMACRGQMSRGQMQHSTLYNTVRATEPKLLTPLFRGVPSDVLLPGRTHISDIAFVNIELNTKIIIF